jgi:hypothetical protein
MFIEFNKYHFYTKTERTLLYWTNKVQEKILQIPEMEKQAWCSKMYVLVGWWVK